ncbi:hypothetical protein LTR37_016550 [Vermiconidia calcicola]|uniref:Uncharacterized protein n=1 Tax=Vermiconidia calcicola TaxID=1690605 RepID=A0ACC3MME2_9PEZI|nr:hypothetical protein LTR37_016550 [Vermiconidia calcicola]
MLSNLFQVLTLVSLSSAHFLLLWPPPAEFDEELQATSPCGGIMPTMDDSTADVQVDRFAISIQNTHPTAEWSFLGTLNTEPPWNFTELAPVVDTTGIGEFCLDRLTAPSEWAGQSGVIQVIDKSPDGKLYQCAAVNFVTGSNNTVGPACSNATNLEATWTSAQSLEGGSASSSSSGVAAMVTGVGSLTGLGLLAAGLAL